MWAGTILPIESNPFRRSLGGWTLLAVLALPACTPGWGRAADTNFATGPELAAQLESPTSVTWSAAPLRRALASLADARGVAVLLDRRIDPEQLIEYHAESRPLREILAAIAQQGGAAYAQVGDVAYIGPSETARRVRTLLAITQAQLQRRGERERRLWSSRSPLEWGELATPGELLKTWIADRQLSLAGLEQVPHDLWPAFQGPPLPLFERVALIAVQFDMTVSFSHTTGQDAQLSPLPDPLSIERTYPAGDRPSERLVQWQEQAPEAEIRLDGKRLVVRGLLEDHERLMPQVTRNVPVAGRGRAESRHRIKVTNIPLEKLLDELQARLDLQFAYDAAALAEAGVEMQAPVSLDLDGATTDELLQAVCRPLGLEFKRRGKKVELTAAR